VTLLLPSLAILGAALALAPVVIHLLSRRRVKRVAWGAFEFLLESHRRNRVWVRWSEWLLVALRALAVALVGLLAARPQTADTLAGWWRGAPATTLVLLDDSYSMGERVGEGSPWRTAIETLDRLAERVNTARGDSLVVWRSNDPAPPPAIAADAAPAANARETTESIARRGLSFSSQGLEPIAAAAAEWIDGARAAGRRVRVVALGDFRNRDHGSGGPLIDRVKRLAASADGLALAPCGATTAQNVAAENVAIESITLAPGPVAPGVEAALVVRIVNHGARPTGEVTVRIERDGATLPAMVFPPTPPGGRAERRAPIAFAKRGPHTVKATLPADALEADNQRTLAVELTTPHEVLLVDGSRDAREGRALAAALAPDAEVRTGWTVRRLTGDRIESLGDLSMTPVVALLDGPTLSSQAVGELRRFVEAGGGVLLSLGPSVDAARFNAELGADAGDKSRVVPWTLDVPHQAPWPAKGRPGVAVSDHPALRVLAGDRNGFPPLVRVSVLHALAGEPPQSTRVVATALGEGGESMPWALEDRLGRGTIVTLLSPAASLSEGGSPWSNLATLPVYPVIANELVGWLAQERLRPTSLLVGDALPLGAGDQSPEVERRDERGVFRALADASSATRRPGVGRVVDGELFAVDVDPAEGELAAPATDELARRFAGVATVTAAEQLLRDASDGGDPTIAWPLAATLLGLLTIERLVACSASHVDGVAIGGKRTAPPAPRASQRRPADRRGVA
jgi:hypothetical protein